MSRRRSRAVYEAPEQTGPTDWEKARTRMLTIADAYQELDDALTEAETGASTGRPGSRLPLSAHVVDVRAQVAGWVTFWARVLMEEVTVERWPGVPWAAERRVTEPWAPPTVEVADLARHIATERIGHLVEHPDPQMRLEFADSLDEFHDLARKTAWPSGIRWLRTGVPCTEHGTSDMGERVPCKGEYRVFMRPAQQVIPDMVCNVDAGHVITPAQWASAKRRKPGDPAAIARLARTLRMLPGAA